MNLTRLCLTAMLWVLASLGVARADRLKVLVIEGASNHDWQIRQQIIRAILSRDGSFELTFSITPGAASDPGWATWAPDFSAYDVVLSGYSNGAGGYPRWPAAVEAAFEGYVNTGGGFVALHEAANSFVDWPEYNNMLGLRWFDTAIGTSFAIQANETLQTFGPGQGEGTSHGQNVDVLVKRLGDHPIHAGLPASWMAAELELWRYPRGPAQNLTILSYAKDALTQLQFPVEWTVNYGAGRVYASTYGHAFGGDLEPRGLKCAAFQETLARALKWCAGVNPAATVPSDFPTPTAITLRAHKEGESGFGGPKPVLPFMNGALPTLSIVPTGVNVVEAFPALDWESPIEAKAWPGQAGQLIVVEMDGRVFKFTDNDVTAVRSEVLNITDRVWYLNWDQGVPQHKHGGVFSTAFHPQFGTGQGKDFLYVYYVHHPTNDDPDATVDEITPFYNRLARFTWNGSAFLPSSEQILLNLHDTAKGHEGGGMVFGSDGFLYLAFGDGGDESSNATQYTQKLAERARSGVFRMDVDMLGGTVSHAIRRQPFGQGSYSQNYFIPKSNPWAEPHVGGPASVLEEFYAIGLREPHRMSFDPASGFWIGDVGAGTFEEIDLMDVPGLNFQWTYKEGSATGFGPVPNPLFGIERGPLHEYGHGIGNCVIGGHVYRGTAIPSLAGKYLYGDNGTQLIYAVEFNPVTKAKISVAQVAQGRAGNIWSGISSFGIDSQGETLVLQFGAGVNGAAQISRLKPAGAPNGGTWTYPPLLSQTGVFTNLATLTPAASMIPYDVNMPLWSAGMEKKRWVIIPNDGVANTPAEQITYSQSGTWELPVGSVFVKHFALPENNKPLETRLLVHGTDGWGGVTYKWRANGLEADLLEDGGVEMITRGATTFEYLYPARGQCMLCHTQNAGPVLGFRTRQLNRLHAYPGGETANQIESLSVAGFINQVLTEAKLSNVLTSADIDDPNVSDEFRARSYFDSNCSHCHQPGGSSRAYFDARLSTPITNQSIVCGPVIDGLSLPSPAVVKPGSLENSVLFQRMNTIDECCSMPPLAKGIIDNDAVATVANWILGMDADSCTKTQSFYGGGTLGLPGSTPEGAHGPDLWHSNMVINENATFTNSTGAPIKVVVDRFQFNAGRTGDPVTPFVVKVLGNNSFTVLAIGSPRTNYVVGANDFPFSDSNTTITLAAGEKIAIGFLDANANGSGGTVAGIIDFNFDGAEIWYTGGDLDSDSGSIAVGEPPQPGSELYTTLNRDYSFAISYFISEYQIGNGTAPPGAEADSAKSNLVINESDTFTNLTADPMTVSVERFNFVATQAGDPLTPFVVKVNSDNNFTVLAIGTTRTSYAAGANDVSFSSASTRIVIPAGTKIATGFLDAFPNGTGGTGPGVVPYTNSGDQIYYSYDVTEVGSSVAVGEAPVPRGYQHTDLTRTYHFSISLGFGGKEDEDTDGLLDRWELAFSPSLTILTGLLDSDGDGMSNLEEYQAGTNPLDPASLLLMLGASPNPGGASASAFVKTVPGRFYKIQPSSNLQTWASPFIVKAADWPATQTEIVMPLSALPPGAAQKLFVRVAPN